MLRRSFFKLGGLVVVGLVAHHKPGHRGGPPPSPLPPVGDVFHDSYGVT